MVNVSPTDLKINCFIFTAFVVAAVVVVVVVGFEVRTVVVVVVGVVVIPVFVEFEVVFIGGLSAKIKNKKISI